ncbi:MAG: class I SAM-dependent methyltransferase [Candidatus Methylomirabilia bacterium]
MNLAVNRSCLVCGSARLGPLYREVRDRYGVASGTYAFLRCDECGSATLDPVPATAVIPALYPRQYTFKVPQPEDAPLLRLQRALEWRAFYLPIYRQRARTFRRLTGLVSGRLLEVGCGSGLFLRHLAAAGYEVEGVDTSEPDVDYARGRLGLPVHLGELRDLPAPDGSYDAVLLFSVLEHVPHPLGTVRETFRMLKPKGWIVLAVPVIDSWQAKLLGRWWGQVTEAPRHLMIPSSAGVRRLLRTAGFRDVRSAPGPLIDNAGVIALSILPGAATPRSYGRSSSLGLILRRSAGALLILPSLLLALAERLPVAGRRAGTMVFCGRKPGT